MDNRYLNIYIEVKNVRKFENGLINDRMICRLGNFLTIYEVLRDITYS
jgi:hypothetical protein